MIVTDEQVATMRAQLAGDREKYERLWAQLDQDAAKMGYTALIAGAFIEAVERRFAQTGTHTDVIEFVADARSRVDELSAKIDPLTAERLILAVYTDEEIDDLDANTVVRTQMLLLATLVADEQFDDAALDDFLGKARSQGDLLLS
jgi:hypothetical protein